MPVCSITPFTGHRRAVEPLPWSNVSDAASPTSSRTTLVTFTGPDRPGIISVVFEALTGSAVTVLDLEQVVVRGRLILAVLLTAPADDARLHEAIRAVAANLDLDVDVTVGTGDNSPRLDGRSHVTVIGQPLRPPDLAAIAGRIADSGANIDRVVRMARSPVTAIELQVSGTDPDLLRGTLAREAARREVDVAVQRTGLHQKGKKLIVLDVDSTLIQGEVIEMLARHAGCLDEVTSVTTEAMRGELDFAESLRRRVNLLAGVDAAALDQVRATVRLTPGADTLVRTLKRLGYQIGVVSGGFAQVVDPLAADLEIDYAAANVLEIADGKLTGNLAGPIVDRAGKALMLHQFAREAGVGLNQTVAIGDGANDLDMLAAAGLGVAFNAKPIVNEAADTAVTVGYLDTVLYLLGLTDEEIHDDSSAIAPA